MKRIIGITFVVLAVMLFSCQKENIEVVEDSGLSEKSAQITLTEVNLEAITTASEYEVEFYANAEQMLTHWWKLGKRWEWTNKTHYKLRQCPNVSIEQGENNGYPKTITLDYGEGTVLKNEKVLSGVIKIEISDPKKSGNYTRMVSYIDFGVDTVKMTGTSLITVNKESETFRNYKSDLAIIINNDKEIVRSSTRTWTWMEGMETTEDQTDDVIRIAGAVNASNSDGDTYQKKILDSNPLVRPGDCRFIVSGVVEVTLNGILISTLNYGEGDCDALATMITADDKSVEVDLTTCKVKRVKNQNKN